MKIKKLKRWLLDHELLPGSQPARSVSGQPFDLQDWRQHLVQYGVLVDEAQMRGTVNIDDWLELARMIFHADDGTTGTWMH